MRIFDAPEPYLQGPIPLILNHAFDICMSDYEYEVIQNLSPIFRNWDAHSFTAILYGWSHFQQKLKLSSDQVSQSSNFPLDRFWCYTCKLSWGRGWKEYRSGPCDFEAANGAKICYAQSEREYHGSYEFKLKGNPWSSGASMSNLISARCLMVSFRILTMRTGLKVLPSERNLWGFVWRGLDHLAINWD